MRRVSQIASTAGYTLVELLAVLAIVGFLAVAAMPILSASQPGLKSKAAARTLAQDLIAARQDAIDRGVVERVVLNPAAGRYAVSPLGAKRELPDGVSLGFHGAASNEIEFYPDGSTSGGTVVLSGAGARHRVTVRWPSGQIAVDE